VDLKLKLTEKDYKAIAERRANRYIWKSKQSCLFLIGFLGVLIAVIPYILIPDGYHYTLGQLLAVDSALVVFLTIAMIFTYAGIVSGTEKSILAKWGIKDKKAR
jgi:VIT1/CCC1 family predicted Fe2+/Mn2+ transporter